MKLSDIRKVAFLFGFVMFTVALVAMLFVVIFNVHFDAARGFTAFWLGAIGAGLMIFSIDW